MPTPNYEERWDELEKRWASTEVCLQEKLFIIKLRLEQPPKSLTESLTSAITRVHRYSSPSRWQESRKRVIDHLDREGGYRLYPDESADSEMGCWWGFTARAVDLESWDDEVIEFFYPA